MDCSCSGSNLDGTARRLSFPDGSQVGIIRLDACLKEVADLKLVDSAAIKEQLLRKVALYNYISSGAEAEYATALFNEYQRKFGKTEGASTPRSVSKEHGG